MTTGDSRGRERGLPDRPPAARPPGQRTRTRADGVTDAQEDTAALLETYNHVETHHAAETYAHGGAPPGTAPNRGDKR